MAQYRPFAPKVHEMSNKRSLAAAVALTVVLGIPVSAQRSDIIGARFVSVQAGFSIDLPSSADDGVLPIGSASTEAGTYIWKRPEGNFTVGFVDGIPGFTDGFAVLNEFADSVTANQLKAGSKVSERMEFSSNGYPGVELRIKRKTGFAVNRCVLVRKRLYILTADFAEGENESVILSILDSFQPIDRYLLVA